MYELLGIKSVDFTGSDGGKVHGRNIYVSYDEHMVSGVATDKFFLSESRFGSIVLSVGDLLDIRFNRYGKVDSIEVMN